MAIINTRMNVKNASGVYDTHHLETNEDVVLCDEGGVTLKQKLNGISNKPVISFCFDDGYIEDNLTYSIFKEYGLTCSFALVTDYADIRNGFNYYRDYIRDGFSVNSHSSTHALLVDDTSTLQKAYYEIVNSKYLMQKVGFDAKGFVASNSIINEKYMNIVETSYDFAYTTYKGILDSSNKGHCNKKTNIHRLYRISLTNNTIEKIKSSIDNCISENGCLFFYDHKTGAEGSNVTVEKLRDILAYVKQKQDENKCIVLNNDRAMQYYYNVNMKNKRMVQTSENIAPNLNEVSSTFKYGSWVYDDHSFSLGMVYSNTFANNEYIGKINYPIGMPINSNSSFQTRIDVNNKNMINETICLGLDLSVSLEDYVDMYLEVTCHNISGDILTLYKKQIEVGTKLNSYGVEITPTTNNVAYVKLYFRVVAKKQVPANFYINIKNPIIGFNNDYSNINGLALDYKDVGNNYAKTLSNPIVVNKSWCIFTCPSYENHLYIGSSDNLSTIEIKKDGIYNIGLNANFNITGAVGATNRLIVRVMKTGTVIETVYRNNLFYTKPNGVVSCLTSNIFKLKKGDKVSVEMFVDSNDATVTFLDNAVLKFECIS